MRLLKTCHWQLFTHFVGRSLQPGVEDYKKNMFAWFVVICFANFLPLVLLKSHWLFRYTDSLLGKPGYESMKADLEARLAAVL
ncbi:MAG: hypothetical protein MJ077_11825 [Oscillospiraceae bacterium]|nr:hypothetical protein [Oscillospiraceae bacterium]